VAAHCSKRSGDFTSEEIRFLTSHFPLITIANGQGSAKYDALEDGMYQAARQLKAASPNTTVLFYWNTFLAYSGYRAYQTFAAHPEWRLSEADGSRLLVREQVETYDLSQPALRDWWVSVAQTALNQAPFDGIFMDAAIKPVSRQQQAALGARRAAAVKSGIEELMEETRAKLGPNAILLYNGLRANLSQASGNEDTLFLEHTSGAMLEHFNLVLERDSDGVFDKEDMATNIALIQQAGARGKIVVVKAWPGFYQAARIYGGTAPPDNPVAAARKAITFPLACFLIAAEPYSYFIYTWGYGDNSGTFEWYPEFDKPLGQPQGRATQNGWVYTRSFEHAQVRVDLASEQATIDWQS
ncbi:MAG TPA: putative glycoside hydrolase, partial [Allocoleopsis sp.]